MGVLGKDLLDFHRPRTNTKVEFGASGYWVESHPTMQPYGAVLQFRALRDQPDETRFCHNTPFCHRHKYLYKKCRQRHLPLAGKYHATSTQIQT